MSGGRTPAKRPPAAGASAAIHLRPSFTRMHGDLCPPVRVLVRIVQRVESPLVGSSNRSVLGQRRRAAPQMSGRAETRGARQTLRPSRMPPRDTAQRTRWSIHSLKNCRLQ